MTRLYDPVAIARQFAYLREAGQNSGQRVNGVQYWSGGESALKTSWCCWWATFVLDICYQGESPVPRLGACQDVYDLAKTKGWLTDMPAPGDLVLSIDPARDHAHHIGILTATHPLTSIAGNTDELGVSSNGDRVAEHVISPANKQYVRIPAPA